MNKRQKKKLSYRKIIIDIRPAVSEDIERCPKYRCFTLNRVWDIIRILHDEYNCDLWFRETQIWESYQRKR